MPVTLKQVAQSLRLSPSLVSGVLNGRDGVWASEQTRARIHAAALEMGYRPNAAARALRSGKTHVVGLLYTGSLNEPVETLAEWLGARGYELRIHVFADQRALLAGLGNAVHSKECDAIVLWGNEQEVEEQAAYLETTEMPFALKGRHEARHPAWPQVDFDHEHMMRQAVDHLVRLGHRRIAYIGHTGDVAYSRSLYTGFGAAMEALAGSPIDLDLVAGIDEDVERAARTVHAWLSRPADLRPTALVVGAGNAAWYGTEFALAMRGRVIGEGTGQFAVIGQARHGLRLAFGAGHAFVDLDFRHLARALADRLLAPLLAGERPLETVIRLRPDLRPTDGLNLLQLGRFEPHELRG